ncbi:unnamed protein product [Clavelina lepadiformis]|uniref:Uncharacterized protein n=1 Tax=Clavelina lepadiformis TaxID=159417 RepID=A0ABP0GWJ5_CLALP
MNQSLALNHATLTRMKGYTIPLAEPEARRILNESSGEEQIDLDTDSESCKKYHMDFGNLLLDSTGERLLGF